MNIFVSIVSVLVGAMFCMFCGASVESYERSRSQRYLPGTLPPGPPWACSCWSARCWCADADQTANPACRDLPLVAGRWRTPAPAARERAAERLVQDADGQDGPWILCRIWVEREVDPATGELMAPEVLRCEVGGERCNSRAGLDVGPGDHP